MFFADDPQNTNELHKQNIKRKRTGDRSATHTMAITSTYFCGKKPKLHARTAIPF